MTIRGCCRFDLLDVIGIVVSIAFGVIVIIAVETLPLGIKPQHSHKNWMSNKNQYSF